VGAGQPGRKQEERVPKRAGRTSRRSVREGMSHRMLLSRRPGRRSAGSIRSGRLCEDNRQGLSSASGRGRPSRRERGREDARGCGENVDAVEAFGAVHLGEHLVDDAVRDACRVVAAARRSKASSALARMHSTRTETEREEERQRKTHRLGAIESNSSKKSTHGLAAWARSNRSRTLFSLAPMYLLRISGPLTLIKLRPHSFATADARSVLPHPGKP